MKKPTSVYLLLLLPLYPALHFYWRNQWLCPLDEAVFILLSALLTGIIIYAICRLARRSHEYAAVFAAILGLGMHSVRHAGKPLLYLGLPAQLIENLYVLLALHILLFLVSLAIARWTEKNTRILAIGGMVSLFLLILPTVGIMGSSMRDASSDSLPLMTQAVSKAGQKPNIVVLLLDGYARNDVLKQMYDYDNSAFLDALRSRGFFVADSSRSNYNQTLLSMLSLFEMTHLDGLPESELNDADAREQLRRRFHRARLWRILRRQGYRTASLTMYNFLETEHDLLTVEESQSQAYHGMRTIYLQGTTWNLVQKIYHGIDENPSLDFAEKQKTLVNNMLTKTCELVRASSPMFVFTHIPHPHPPFVYGEGENAVRGSFEWFDGSHYLEGNNIDSDTYRRLYRSQLRAMNPIILSAIDELLEDNQSLALYVISDHGPGSELDWESPDATNMIERFATLFAARMPTQGWMPYNNNTTLVNTWQPLLEKYFGERYDMVKDVSLNSTFTHPLDFSDVTSEAVGAQR